MTADPSNEAVPRSLDFMIVGAQKSGTTALAHFLDQHSGIDMAAPKECHLFDSPYYNPEWSAEDINRRYAGFFEQAGPNTLRGEATPAYMFYEDIAAGLARYNPSLKLIVTLRDPADRAISHYRMERVRGLERWPLWWALMLEAFAGRSGGAPRSPGQHFGRYAYRQRGLYTRQIGRLLQHFPAEQLLIISQADLLEQHEQTLSRVFSFLGLEPEGPITPEMVRHGTRTVRDPDTASHWLVRCLLKFSYRAEYRRLRRDHGIGF